MRKIHMLKAKFDAASTSPEAMRHWKGAENLSADAELLPDVRRRVVGRSRFEAANNGYLAGILQTLSHDTVGTGPRLQLTLDDYDSADDYKATSRKLRRREKRFKKYAKKISLAAKLRLARLAKARDGEVFIKKVINPGIDSVNNIDIVLYESEQVGSETLKDIDEFYDNGVPKEIDGILYDRIGNPTYYRFWKIHPGAINNIGSLTEFDLVPARSVIHYGNFTRPGQHRGFPEIANSLTVFNDFRRYGNAVVAAAETAAVISFLLETDLLPDPEEFDLSDELTDEGKRIKQLNFTDVVPMAKNAGVALPEGWKGHQLKAEQPTNTYSEFVDAKLNEAARGLSMPFNVAKGNSSGYNYASGRLDHQVYHREIDIERQEIENLILDNLYENWSAIDEVLNPGDYEISGDVDYYWMWDGFEYCDPAKESNAQTMRLANGTSTLAEECAARGRDWETVLYQRAREAELQKELGLISEPAEIQNETGKEDE